MMIPIAAITATATAMMTMTLAMIAGFGDKIQSINIVDVNSKVT